MKALLSAFALLSFIAASTLPMTASAEEMKSDQSTTNPADTGSMHNADTSGGTGTTDTHTSATSNAHKTHKTATHKTPHHKKKTTKKKTHHKHTASHKPKPKNTSTAPKQG